MGSLGSLRLGGPGVGVCRIFSPGGGGVDDVGLIAGYSPLY